MKKKKGISGGKILAAGAGVAALAGGAYYLLGPDAKKNQKKALATVAKMKKEVEKEMKKAKEVGIPAYHKAVDVISENYAKQYEMHAPEIRAFAQMLKKEWKGVVKKAAKQPVKKPTKVFKKKKAK
jgi:hypothetical protein